MNKREFFLEQAIWWQRKAALTHELIEGERAWRNGNPWGTIVFLQRLSASRSKMARQFLIAAIDGNTDVAELEPYGT
jgi:hypothetical protein